MFPDLTRLQNLAENLKDFKESFDILVSDIERLQKDLDFSLERAEREREILKEIVSIFKGVKIDSKFSSRIKKAEKILKYDKLN